MEKFSIADYSHSPSPALFLPLDELGASSLKLSIVIPIFNESESIPLIYARLTDVLVDAPASYSQAYEIILVDDGSTDGSFQICADLQQRDTRVRVVQLRRNFGKTAALNAAFTNCRGRYVVTIDADMQEDPGDMFRLLDILDAGFDLVSGWREQRHDPPHKTIPSLLFNRAVSLMTGVSLHDFNCGFKAYRREVVMELQLYGELHRFIPVLAHQRGFRVTEIPVMHQPRRFGRSKFGASRLNGGFLDFLEVLFMIMYLQRPFRLFGMIGTLCCTLGSLLLGYLGLLWVMEYRPIGNRPLLILGVMLILMGLQFLSMGFVGIMVRHLAFHPGDEFAIRRIIQDRGSADGD